MKSRAVAPVAAGYVLSRAVFRVALFAVLAVVGLSGVSLRAESANSYYKHGESAEAREDYDAAFNNYQKAHALAPKDLRYRSALYRIRISASSLHLTKGRKLFQAGDEPGALAEFLRAAEIDPGNEAAQQEIARVRAKHGETAPQGETSIAQASGAQEEINSIGSPAALKPVSNEPLTLHMTEDAKVVYQAVGKAAGVNVLFDPEFTSKRVQVDLNNVSLVDALRIVGTISNTFWRAVTSNTIFVAQNTTAKRRDLDEQAVETFYLTNAWQQNDLNDVQTALRNVMPNAKVYGVASQNAIIMRGTPDELLLAQKLINDLDKARAEVVVDIAVLEVSKNWERNLGITWPSTAGVALQSPTASTSSSSSSSSSSTSTSSTTSSALTISNLAHLNANDFAVTIGAVTANLLLTDTNTKILDNPRIRCTDGQKATMKIGTRIPIATGSYGGGGLGGVGGVGGIGIGVQTQFQYIDVGVNIEVTPTIHFDHDVTLKIKMEDSSEDGNVTISGVTEPIIAQKTSEQVIRLREGEASVMSGMVNKTDIQSWNGIPGLSSIPGLKYLFGSKDHQIQEDEIIFLLVPHIVRTQELEQANLRSIDTGVGTSIELRHISSEGPGSNPASNPASAVAPVRPVTQSVVGTVPGQSAPAAAPAALAQLRAAAETNGDVAAAKVTPSPSAPGAGKASLVLTPPDGPVAAGSTFKVPIVMNNGTDIASVPVQIQYDPASLSLVNVDIGDFLNRNGQTVEPIHRDDGPGTLTINASRPLGAAGVSGTGAVYILSFQAKAAGESAITIIRAAAVNTAQQQTPVQGAHVSIHVK